MFDYSRLFVDDDQADREITHQSPLDEFFFPQFVFHPFARRYVLFDGNIIGDNIIFVANGCNRGVFPVQLAIFMNWSTRHLDKVFCIASLMAFVVTITSTEPI